MRTYLTEVQWMVSSFDDTSGRDAKGPQPNLLVTTDVKVILILT
jgi:hypothetical protein